MQNKIHNLIIIGSGPAGLTAGIYSARSNLEPLIIEGANPGGQLMGTSFVENWPGEKSILGPDLINNISNQALSLGCCFLSETITKVDFSKKPFTLWTNKDKELKSRSVIIATGSAYKKLNCKGEAQYWGKGVTTCATCDGAFYKNRPVIIVGGGDSAMEEAHFMTKFTDQITVIHILDKLTASPAMQKKVLGDPRITLIYNSTITEITGDGNHINQVVIMNQKTHELSTLRTDVVFVAIGLTPNSGIFQNQIEIAKSGHIVTKDGTQTSITGIFAAGDIVDYKYRQAITSAGTGCSAALDAERYLSSL